MRGEARAYIACQSRCRVCVRVLREFVRDLGVM